MARLRPRRPEHHDHGRDRGVAAVDPGPRLGPLEWGGAAARCDCGYGSLDRVSFNRDDGGERGADLLRLDHLSGHVLGRAQGVGPALTERQVGALEGLALEDLQSALPRFPLLFTELEDLAGYPPPEDLSQLGVLEIEDPGVVMGRADLDMKGHATTICSEAMELPLPAAVVFDNDGLLLDTESVWTRAEQDLFERRGIEFTPADKRELVGTSAEVAGGILERRLGEPGRAAELINELNELVVAELEHGVEAMVGASELLHQLKRRGTPIGLVSNSPLIFVQRSLEIVGFADHFDVVISAHEVAAPKPAPDPYLEACRRLGVEAGPAVVALEDSPTGVAAARAAGLTVIGVPSLEGIELVEAHEIAESLLDGVVARHLVLGAD